MLKMFPGKNKTQVSTYDGEYREADITKFIKLKASHPVDIPEETPKEEDILKEVENILKQSEEKVKEDDEKDHDDDKKEDKKENDSDSDGEDNEKNTKKGAGAGGDL
eukprot:TRINITY_DN7736_c0_g1_i11.p1 TRINITY_DN7736_c0_g1~~TRINITY_DN7736_c0_g1_i11.p1  ORF type:complete len:107 (-),score=42.59 TRINITY_DN7736_c0_g1_i11:55-375(-)